MLGPYRNLTTLSASLVALHENCRVLNHAGEEILADPGLNFFAGYTPAKFNAFVRFAHWASEGGAGGQLGGSIVHSHAFRRPAMRQAYEERRAGSRGRERTCCLLWKESLRTNNAVRQHRTDLAGILRENPMLRFLMPIRFPLDCARSNLKTGHVRLFPGLQEGASETAVLDAILEEIRWFFDWHHRSPDRFFYFYQHRFDAEKVRELGRFLDLPDDDGWVEAVLGAYVLDASYSHSEELRSYYDTRVREVFADRPEVMEALLEMNQPSGSPEAAPGIIPSQSH